MTDKLVYWSLIAGFIVNHAVVLTAMAMGLGFAFTTGAAPWIRCLSLIGAVLSILGVVANGIGQDRVQREIKELLNP